MEASGYVVDPVDREFDRMLEEAGRAGPSPAATPLDDDVFESLLTEFRTLNGSHGAGAATADENASAPPTDVRVPVAAARLTQALRELTLHPSVTREPELQRAIRRLGYLGINLQLALRDPCAHTVLAVGAAGQSFALPPARVIEIREDATPAAHSLRAWLAPADDVPEADALHVVVSLADGRRATLAVDGVEGLLAAERRAPGPLLRGTPGIAGIAAAGTRLLPLLDVDALLAGADRTGG